MMEGPREYVVSFRVRREPGPTWAAGVLTVSVTAHGLEAAIDAARDRIVSLGFRPPAEPVNVRQRASGWSTAWEPASSTAS